MRHGGAALLTGNCYCLTPSAVVSFFCAGFFIHLEAMSLAKDLDRFVDDMPLHHQRTMIHKKRDSTPAKKKAPKKIKCDGFIKDQSTNPMTGKSIVIGGPTWKKLMTQCVCKSRNTEDLKKAGMRTLPRGYSENDSIIRDDSGKTVGWVGKNGKYYYTRPFKQ